MTVSGQVLNPDRRPVARAKVAWRRQKGSEWEVKETATAADGKFSLELPRDGFSAIGPAPVPLIVATAEGYGWQAIELSAKGDNDLVLVLPKDLPIRGKILTLEGAPAKGARVRLSSFVDYADGNLDKAIVEVREGVAVTSKLRHLPVERLFTAPGWIEAGNDGGFTIAGCGAERAVGLRVEGPGIHHKTIRVLTREMEPIKVNWNAIGAITPQAGYPVYGATFQHLAFPSRLLRGKIRDRESKLPIEGVELEPAGFRDTNKPIATNANGEFEFVGVPKIQKYPLWITCPKLPYISKYIEVQETPGLDPIDVSVELTRGIPVTGRVLDSATGQPVAGSVQYFPLFPNVYAAKEEHLGAPCTQSVLKADGRFEVTAFPGPGILAVSMFDLPHESNYMEADISIDEVKRAGGRAKRGWVTNTFIDYAAGGQSMSSIHRTGYRALKLIALDEGAKLQQIDLTVTPSRPVEGQVVDTDGKPIDGVQATGLRDFPLPLEKLPTSRFKVLGLNPREPRHLIFIDNARQLAASFDLGGSQTNPLAVKLVPCGTIVGRLVDDQKKPFANANVVAQIESFFHYHLMVQTDANGGFRVEGLVPDEEYRLQVNGKHVKLEGFNVKVESGQTRDLGELTTYE